MKKLFSTIIITILSLFAFAAIAGATTLDQLSSYMDTVRFYEMRAAEDAPSGITDAGVETINGATGTVTYTRDELILPGKGGMDFTVRRRFDGNQEEDSYTIERRAYLYLPDGWEREGCKYLFKYITPEGNSVFVAFDTPEQMREMENGNGSITVASAYTTMQTRIMHYSYNGDLYYEYSIGNTSATGVGMGDYYLYAPDALGNDVVLTRDPTAGVSKLYIAAVGSYVYIYNDSQEMGWEYDEPVITYTPTPVSRGNATAYIDSGTFYDPELGVMLDFEIDYQTNTPLSTYNVWTDIYVYGENESVFTRKTTDMYVLYAEQNAAELPLKLRFVRYDNTEYVFEIPNTFTPIYAYEKEKTISGTRTYYINERVDKYGNRITRTNRNTTIYGDFVDTLGRTINLRETYVKVNGSVVLKYTETKGNNDVAFDPNDAFDFDDIDTLIAENCLTGKKATYNMRYSTLAFIMGQKNQSHNPHRMTLPVQGYIIDNVQLPTGGSIYYEYDSIEGVRPETNPDIRAELNVLSERVTGKYLLESEDATPTQRHSFAYDLTNSAARKFTTTYPDAPGVTRTQTFDKFGNVTEEVQKSTQPENAYYIRTQNIYLNRKDGKRLLGTQTVTTKTSETSTGSNTVTTAYDYTEWRLPTTETRDGEVVRYRTYFGGFSGKANLLKEDFTLQSDGKWVGVINESSDDLNITKSTYTVRTGTPDAIAESSTLVETFTYTDEGDLNTHTKGGTTTTYTYDYADYTTDEAWQNNYITTSISGVTGLTDETGAVKTTTATLSTRTGIDRYGRTVSQRDARGNTTAIAYDYNATANTYTNTVTYADNATETTVMDFAANSVIATDADGVKIKTVFNALGQESALYQYTNGAWVKAYDVMYDNMGRASAKIVYADGTNEISRVTYTYYADGQIASETVTQGATVLSKKEYAYAPYAGNDRTAASVKTYANASDYLALSRYTDKYGYAVEDVLSDGTNTYTQSYQMDKAGNLTAYRDFNANAADSTAWTETYTYDLKNRPLSTTNAAGTTSSTYNQLDQVATATDAKGAVMRYVYNKAGMLTEQYVDVDGGARVKYYYDANGNNTRTDTYTDASNYRTVQYFYDNRNRVIAAKIGNQITKYSYTPGGRTASFALGFDSVTAEADANTQITSYTYDDLGRLFSTTDPMGNSETNTYDNLNQLVSKTDRNGAVTTYAYDGLGRTASITAAQEGKATETISYTYDYNGNVTSMLDSSGTTVYNYDVRGLLLSETKGDIVKTYTYDANGNRTSFVAPSIDVNTSYTYDSLGRMLTVSDTAFGTTTYTYDANSNLTSVNNGTTTATMSYDAQNRLVSKYSGADTYTLTYYNDGNVKRVTDSEGTINYTYNETGALASGDGATYTYDKYGNRSEMTKDGNTYCYYYDKNNRLIREADFAGNIASAYRYDNNGNLVERQHQPETTEPTENLSESLSVVSAPTFTTDTFTFDVLGRMSSANVNGTTTTYTYDGNGLRQTKNNKAFVYDGANIVWEGESLTTGTTYYRGLELIAYKPQGSARTFYQTDWHGNIEGYDYDDFGNPTGGNALNPFRYNGEYYDEETGFIYLRARYYDPSVGRFVSEDPIRDGLNWYAYCHNDPINFYDPFGMWEEGDEKLPEFIQKAIQVYTDEWYAADERGDIEGKERAHEKAESARALADSFVTREEWGAIGVGDKFGSDPDKHTIVIHHTVGNKSINAIEKGHIKDGFGTVGYHFVIDTDGTVYEGTPLENRGAHVNLYNTGLIGISLIGNFEPNLFINNTPEEPQLLSMMRLVQALKDGQGIYTVKGHRDYNGVVEGTKDTVCPGENLYEIINRIY